MITFSMTFSFFCTPVSAKKETSKWPDEPSIFGEAGVLIDADTGTVLFDKKSHKKMYPASITKIMTALLTIENCKLDDTVVFSDKAIGCLSYDDANIACQVGEKMSVKECLYALMLSSANEVAAALGEQVAGSKEKFAEMMNQRAKQAGAKNTHFVNANGLHDENHYVTAYDMAMIMKDALSYPVFREIINSTSYKIGKNNKRKESFTSYQRHKMVWPTSGFYYEGIIGGKTGYTDQSGTTLVTSAKRDGMTLISVVLKSNGNNVYEDTKILLDYGFKNFQSLKVSEYESSFSEDATAKRKSPFCDATDSIAFDNTSSVVIPQKAKFSDLTKTVTFNLTDKSFATITYQYFDKIVGYGNLVYTHTTYGDASQVPQVTTTANVDTKQKNEVPAVEESTTQETKKSRKPIKIPAFVLPLGIAVVIIICIFILIKMQQRRLNKIRAMKRHRKR